MKLFVADIPDEAAELPGWLERHLVGLDLGALVAELTAIHGTDDAPPLMQVLGDRRKAVLDEGLAVLPTPTLRLLLRHPALLTQLQELVLAEGGPCWQQVADADVVLQTRTLRGEARLVGLFAEPAPAPRPQVAAGPVRRSGAAWWRYAATGLVTAAAMLLAVYLFRELLARRILGPSGESSPPSAAASAWGWDKLGTPSPEASARDYLNSLADAADEWFQKRPDDAPALARRIGEMRLGCSRLILAEHAPLKNPEQREWLRGKCRDWAAKLDRELAELEGGRPAGEVRAEMDSTVRKLVATLRERAG